MLKDQEARDIIAKELTQNLMVEAGAGSGKTEEMSKRILALVSAGYRDISEIAAITFTRKAANELKERIRKKLKDEYELSGNELQKKALDNIHECFIGTIHAFCGKLLRERPIEAGIDPEFEQIDEAQDTLTRQKIWEDYVLHAGEDETEILKLMDVFSVNERVAGKFLQYMCENQDVEFVLQKEPKISYDDLLKKISGAVKKLSDYVNSYYGYIPDEIINNPKKGDKAQENIIEFRYKLRGRSTDELSDSELFQMLMVFSAKNAFDVTLIRWGDSPEENKTAKSIKEKSISMRDLTVAPLMYEISIYVYNEILLPFTLRAKKLYFKHKHTVAELNYQDLLIASSDMLRDYPDVRRYFQSRYKTLLIDEFQDTDPIQIRMSMYLTGQELEEKRWNKITPIEGSLFVVGDPKQSIYGFRRADFEMYKRFQEHMIESGGKLISLHTNFRAVDKLGEWYNKTFPALLGSEGQAAFTNMDAVMPTIDGTLSGVTYYRIDESKSKLIIEKDIEHLTRIINHIVGRKSITKRVTIDGKSEFGKETVQYRDIMILAMTKKQVAEIGTGIAKNGIPLKITGGDITKRTSEFVAFHDLIRLLAYPEENAYIYNVMSGSFFNFSDQDIYRYSSLGGSLYIKFDFDGFLEENNLKDEDKKLFLKVKDCFSKALIFSDYMKKLSPAAATERIIEELGIMQMHLTSGEKKAGLGSFVSLIEKIRLKKITDVWGLDLFLDELALMIENGFEEDVDIEGKDYNAVRIMNTHKAKGLEAPIIILCAPCGAKAWEPMFYTKCEKDDDDFELYYGYTRLQKNIDDRYTKEYHQFYEPAGWRGVEDKARSKEALERERLLYVAATRAKNLLIISDSAAKRYPSPWKKLLGKIPPGTSDLLAEVYAEEEDAAAAAASSHLLEGDDALTVPPDIKSKRDEALLSNQNPSFEMYAPSELVHRKHGKVEDYELTHETEKAILENTMVVIIDGDETQVKTDRLELGTDIHKLLETLIKDEASLPAMIDSLADEDSYATKEFLESVVNDFKSKKLYERVKKADAVYTEVPFSHKVEAGKSYAGETFEQNTYINGIIDLVFREGKQWAIVDYKTYSENEVAYELLEKYKPQLQAYKEVWAEMSGEPVGEPEIFFIMKRMAG